MTDVLSTTSATATNADAPALLKKIAALESELASTKAELATTKAALAAAQGGGSSSAAAAAAAAAPAAVDRGAAVGELPEASFLSPRGKFRLKLFEHALVLVGKSAEVVVPLASIAKYWMLPDPDNRGHFFALTLASPVANGKSQLHHVSLLTKEGDAHPKPSLTLSSAAGAAVVDGTLAQVLATALAALLPSVAAGDVGSFRPARGAALQCYNKATEAALYVLGHELLVKEGGARRAQFGSRNSARAIRRNFPTASLHHTAAGKALALPYKRLRVELLPPSGRRTFDIQLECAPAADAAEGTKPTKLELSMIAAEEFHKLADFLRQKRANVNGSLDKAEKSADGEASAADGDEGEGEGEDDEDDDESGEEGDDDDDSDESGDEDFNPGEESEIEEEYDTDGGEEIEEVDGSTSRAVAAGSEDDDEDEDDEEEGRGRRRRRRGGGGRGGGGRAAEEEEPVEAEGRAGAEG